jgi:predicted DNA-binding transcriptional regulator AlpA
MLPNAPPLRVVAGDADTLNSPLVADAADVAVMLRISVRTVRTWDAAGKLPKPIRIGGRVVWRLDELRDWLNADAPDRETWTARRAARK